jgi:hypothetical protein
MNNFKYVDPDLKNNCRYVKSSSDVSVTDYISLPADENTIKTAVETIGPVAVGMDYYIKICTILKIII